MHKYPLEFLKRIDGLPEITTDEMVYGLVKPIRTSVHVNRKKWGNAHISPGHLDVPWCKNGFYLTERPEFVFDPLFHAGAYYVQEASSMIINHIINKIDIKNNLVWLDLCAAPGGKSAILSSNLPDNTILVSNEVVGKRVPILFENLQKWGSENKVIINNTSAQIAASGIIFDLILADMPCSGEGMFRKDNNAITHWSEDNVLMCAKRQRQIAQDIWPSLKENGFFIYSTCTFNIEENEQNVHWIMKNLGAECIHISTDDSWGVVHSKLFETDSLRFYPSKLEGEGLFVAVLRKTNTELSSSPKIKFKKETVIKPEKIDSLINNANVFKPIEFKNQIVIYRSEFDELVFKLKQLNMIGLGLPVFSKQKNLLLPNEFLVFHQAFNKNGLPSVELEWDKALSYLSLNTVETVASGNEFVYVSFNNIPLGLAKRVANRLNNHFPKNWKIRTLNRPEKPIWHTI